MSYTFSRRNFMKFTALTAAAVALSGSLTGCSNPNQPAGKPGETLTFGGSSGLWGSITGSNDKHTLANDVTYSNQTLTCHFNHKPVITGTSCTPTHYQLRIVTTDGSVRYVVSNSTNITSFAVVNGGDMQAGDEVNTTLTVTGLDLSDAEEVYVQYFPLHNALGAEKDTYADVFATWDITSVITG